MNAPIDIGDPPLGVLSTGTELQGEKVTRGRPKWVGRPAPSSVFHDSARELDIEDFPVSARADT